MGAARIDVAYIAKLARIELNAEEADGLAVDLEKVLNYVSQLEAYDTTGVSPMNHPLELMDCLRPDVVGESLSVEDALRNAPQQSAEQIRVPKVVESA